VNGYKLCVLMVSGLLLASTLPARAEMEAVESSERMATEASVAVGYRGVSVHGEPARAREYDSLQSSPLFDTRLFVDRGSYHLDLGVDYLNDNDYSANVNLNTKGQLRLDLRTERFFHNLDHIPYDNGSRGVPVNDSTPRPQPFPAVEGSRPDGWFANSTSALRTYYTDQNPDDDYGLRLDMSEAKLKIKCPDYPAHLNLSYWRYEKQGDRQHRFLSEGGIQTASGAGEGNCVGCHMESKSRDIDRVTEEFKAGVDAHAGFVDVVLETLYRTFRDREEVPVDTFGVHERPGLHDRDYGNYEHSEDPDSNLKEMTLRLNTAPSGGLVGSASFTIGERENRSDLTSVAPVDAETDYYKTTADVTYAPNQNWTVNLRYRLLDLDSDNTSWIDDTAAGINAFRGPVAVRESMDVTRAWYEAVASYRPTRHLTLKGELRREEIDRSNTGAPVAHNSSTTPITINPTWQLPDEEVVTRVKLGFSSRLLEKSALKLSGWLAIQQNDDPAYGTSYGESQELFLGGSYASSPLWGLQANLNLLKQENDDFEINGQSIDRRKEQQTLSFGTWVTPRENLSFDLYYGYFRTDIDQTMFYGGTAPYAFSDDGADYQQTVQTLTAGMTWQALADLSCRIEGYHIRSKASYDPDFPTTIRNDYGNAANISGIVSSTDLHDISKVDIAQNGLKGRVDWKLSENLTCGVEATFDDYDEKGNDVYDGSVQSYMASLTYTF
jgi:opacity protein-like surface antigen